MCVSLSTVWSAASPTPTRAPHLAPPPRRATPPRFATSPRHPVPRATLAGRTVPVLLIRAKPLLGSGLGPGHSTPNHQHLNHSPSDLDLSLHAAVITTTLPRGLGKAPCDVCFSSTKVARHSVANNNYFNRCKTSCA